MTARKNRTRLWFALHGWFALPIWLFLFFVCVTGTIATIDKEIMWLVDPTVRAGNPDNLDRKPLNQIVEGIRQQVAGAHVSGIRFGEPFMALEVRISTPDTPNAIAWVNPYSGAVQSVVRGINFPNFMKALHGWLLMPWHGGTPIGWYAVTGLSIPLLGSLVTGVVVYKRFWRAFFTPRLRTGSGSRVFWGDFHRLAGVWSLWFIAVMSLTGLWFLIMGLMVDAHIPLRMENPDIPRREAPVLAAGEALPQTDLDGAVATVQALRPGTQPISVRPPEHALGTIVVYSRSSFPILAEEVWIHPYSGEVLGLRDMGVASFATIGKVVADSLHYGNFAGVWVKLIWTFFGILLSGLVLSGMVIWTKRTVRATWAAPAPTAAPALAE